MALTDETLATLRTEGYAVVEGYLDAQELAAARKLLNEVFPPWEEFSANRDKYTDVTGSAVNFGTVKQFPDLPAELHLNLLKPELIEFAQKFIGDEEVVCDQSLLSGKYAGLHTEDQFLHADYGNHTLVFPDDRYLAGMIYYADVTVALGATWIVSRRHTTDARLVPNVRTPDNDPELYEHQRPVEGPAGTMLLYTMSTFHRGAKISAKEGARFNHHFCYRPARVPWTGWYSWPMLASSGDMPRLLQTCTVQQRNAMGFPRPGDPYWTPRTIAGVKARYPEMDMAPYER